MEEMEEWSVREEKHFLCVGGISEWRKPERREEEVNINF
jgi:hypothetical protein